MCGIVGLIKPRLTMQAARPYHKWIKEALLCNQVRGMDGTGIATYNITGKSTNPEVSVYKRALDAGTTLQLRQFNKLMLDIDEYRAIVGHNRATTSGGNTDDACHPFQVGDITLVHNGTLHGKGGLKEYSHTVTDSFNIADNLSKHGVDETLSNISGAFALVWLDKSDNTLHLARNDQRPLFFVQSIVPDKGTTPPKVTLFGSEIGMLYWLAERNDIIMSEEFYNIEPYMHYVFDIENPHEYTTSKFDKYTVASYYKGGRSWGPSPRGANPPWQTGGSSKSTDDGEALAVGKQVQFTPTTFNKYGKVNNVSMGTLIGHITMPSGKQYYATMYNMPEADYQNMPQLTKVDISAIRCGRGNNIQVVVELADVLDTAVKKLDNEEVNIAPANTHNVSKRELKGLIGKGCMYCADPVPYRVARECYLVQDDNEEYVGVLCPKCKEDETAVELAGWAAKEMPLDNGVSSASKVIYLPKKTA